MNRRQTLQRARRGGVAALFVAVAVMGAACGDDDDSGAADGAFVDRYQEVTTGFERRTEEIRAQGRTALGGGDAAVLAVYEDLLAASRDAHEAYTDIEPVPDVRPAFEDLVEQLESQTEVLSAVVEAAKAGDDAALAAGLQELAAVVVEVTNARRTVDRQLGELDGTAADE